MPDDVRLPALAQTNMPMASAMLWVPETFAQAQRIARLYAESELVPQHMRNIANTFIALQIAARTGEDPLLVMQNIYIAQGNAGWKSAYLIARMNQSGKFRDELDFDIKDDGRRDFAYQKKIGWDKEAKRPIYKQETINLRDITVTVSAVLAKTGKEKRLSVSMETAAAEGWVDNQKYRTLPEQMLCYRAATFFCRLYSPEVLIGLPTQVEIEDAPAGDLVQDGGVYVPTAAKPRPKESAFRAPPQQAAKVVDITPETDVRVDEPMDEAGDDAFVIVNHAGEVIEAKTIEEAVAAAEQAIDEAAAISEAALDGWVETNGPLFGALRIQGGAEAAEALHNRVVEATNHLRQLSRAKAEQAQNSKLGPSHIPLPDGATLADQLKAWFPMASAALGNLEQSKAPASAFAQFRKENIDTINKLKTGLRSWYGSLDQRIKAGEAT